MGSYPGVCRSCADLTADYAHGIGNDKGRMPVGNIYFGGSYEGGKTGNGYLFARHNQNGELVHKGNANAVDGSIPGNRLIILNKIKWTKNTELGTIFDTYVKKASFRDVCLAEFHDCAGVPGGPHVFDACHCCKHPEDDPLFVGRLPKGSEHCGCDDHCKPIRTDSCGRCDGPGDDCKINKFLFDLGYELDQDQVDSYNKKKGKNCAHRPLKATKAKK